MRRQQQPREGSSTRKVGVEFGRLQKEAESQEAKISIFEEICEATFGCHSTYTQLPSLGASWRGEAPREAPSAKVGGTRAPGPEVPETLRRDGARGGQGRLFFPGFFKVVLWALGYRSTKTPPP